MTKPSVIGFEAATKPVSKGRGRIQVHTNMNQVIPAAVYYELMVAYETTEGTGQKSMIDDMYRAVQDGFGEYVDSRARTRPKELQHVYEWDQNGTRNGRLWRVTKNMPTDTGFTLGYKFVNSRKVAPIPPALREPGPTGKVVKKSAVFRKKAEVIESGRPVIIRRKTAKYLAIPTSTITGVRNRLGITFSRGPVKIEHPGGRESTHGFLRAFQAYFGAGVATRHLKSRGFLDNVPKVMKKAGEDLPAQARVGGRVSKSSVEAAARQAVLREASKVYGK